MKAPQHLQTTTKKWFTEVAGNYELEPHHLRLLVLAAESWDRCQQAREAIAEHGLTYSDKLGYPRARPEVGIERDARLAFARLVRELALDLEPPRENRPPQHY